MYVGLLVDRNNTMCHGMEIVEMFDAFVYYRSYQYLVEHVKSSTVYISILNVNRN